MSSLDLAFGRAPCHRALDSFSFRRGNDGQEQAIAGVVTEALVGVGVPPAAIRHDDAQTHIPLPTQTGNLIVTLPGTRPDLPRLLFMTHLDTVPLCAGAKPVLRDGRIVPPARPLWAVITAPASRAS